MATKMETMQSDLANAEDQINIEKSAIANHKADLQMWEIEKSMILDEIELEKANNVY